MVTSLFPQDSSHWNIFLLSAYRNVSALLEDNIFDCIEKAVHLQNPGQHFTMKDIFFFWNQTVKTCIELWLQKIILFLYQYGIQLFYVIRTNGCIWPVSFCIAMWNFESIWYTMSKHKLIWSTNDDLPRAYMILLIKYQLGRFWCIRYWMAYLRCNSRISVRFS